MQRSASSATAPTASSSSAPRTSSAIARRCLFVGYQDDVARFYSAIDALILPSANEGTPVSVIEALAAQRPAVATRVGGVPDVIRDEIDGFLVELGDAEAIADHLAELGSATPSGGQRWAPRAARACSTRYAVGRLVDDIDGLYRSLLAGHERPAGATCSG